MLTVATCKIERSTTSIAFSAGLFDSWDSKDNHAECPRFFLQVSSGMVAAWRNAPRKTRPDIWCLQETHVATQDEAEDLNRDWNWVRGLSTEDPASPLSYWSLGTRQAGGVAFLLTPDLARSARPWPGFLTTPRQIALSV